MYFFRVFFSSVYGLSVLVGMTPRDWDVSAQLSGIIFNGPVGRAEKTAFFLGNFTLKGGSDMLSQNVCNRPPACAA